MATVFSNFFTISPASGVKHSATVIFLHGLGDGGNGWYLGFKQVMANRLPHVKFLFPIAPIQPVTLNMGYPMPSWYDIYSLDGDSREDKVGLLKAKSLVKSLVVKEISENGIPLNRIVLGGFSQGGATSLLSGLTLTRSELEKECGANVAIGNCLGGIISLSAYLPIREYLAEQAMEVKNMKVDANQIPILMCHGTNDSVVSFEWGKKSLDFLIKSGISSSTMIQFKSYPGMDHGSCQSEMQDILLFLSERLSEI